MPHLPLVLLAPFPFDSGVFDGFREAFPGPLLTPDPQPGGEPDLGVLADRVVSAMDEAGMARAVVGGVSMGGYVALALLERHPERCAGLVLIDSKAAADTAAARDQRWAVAARADAGIRPAAADLLPTMLSARTLRERQALVADLAATVDRQPIAEIAWKQRAMAARPDRAALLADTPVPVLVVVGIEDTITPPGASAAMAREAGATWVEITDAGHLAVVEQPAAVARALTEWLDASGPT